MYIQWPFVIFMLFFCAAAGMICGLGVLVFRGKARGAYLPGLIVSAVLVVASGVSAFVYLPHWERIFYSFTHLSSGIARELLGIVVAAVVLVVFFVLLRKAGKDEPLPKWLGALLAVVGLAMAITGASSYYVLSRSTGMNLTTILYYLDGVVVMGASGLWALTSLMGEKDLAKKFGIVTLASALVLAVLVVAFYLVAQSASFTGMQTYFDPTNPTKQPVTGTSAFSRVLAGQGAAMFWGGALVAGAVVPALLGLLSLLGIGQDKVFSVAAFLCAVVGSAFFRAVFYVLGIMVFGVF